jgi:hypothetical protein
LIRRLIDALGSFRVPTYILIVVGRDGLVLGWLKVEVWEEGALLDSHQEFLRCTQSKWGLWVHVLFAPHTTLSEGYDGA